MKDWNRMQKVVRDHRCHWERREQGYDKRTLSDVSGGPEVDFRARGLLAALPFLSGRDRSWSKAPDESVNHTHGHWKENNWCEFEHLRALTVVLKQTADKISSNRNMMFTCTHKQTSGSEWKLSHDFPHKDEDRRRNEGIFSSME